MAARWLPAGFQALRHVAEESEVAMRVVRTQVGDTLIAMIDRKQIEVRVTQTDVPEHD